MLSVSDIDDLIQKSNDSSTIIHAAVASLNCDNLELVLKHLKWTLRYKKFKLLLNHINSHGDSAIFDAVRLNQKSMFTLLIENGADYLLRGSERGTVLHASIISRQLDNVKFYFRNCRGAKRSLYA